jgi:hypothetical protein
MIDRKRLALNAMLALGVSGASQAGVLFNPNGTGAAGAIDVGTFDWAQTSFVAVGGNQAVTNFQNGCAQSCEFTVYTQARLNGTNSQANVANTPAGLNNAFEITMVLGFRERVTTVIPPGTSGQAAATFQAIPTGTSFLQVFRDSSVDANPLTGYGFNDGTLILSGSGITQANGLFSVNLGAGGNPTVVPIDRFGANEYTGQDTVTGQGGTGDFAIGNLTPALNYFTNGLGQFGVTMANISQTLPFVTVDPMDCFTISQASVGVGQNAAPSGCANNHVNGTFAANVDPANGPGSYVPVTGNINGLFAGTGVGPDFVAQTDYNSTLRPGVPIPPQPPLPEPASLALLGLGLGLLGAYKGRRSDR